jgi:hypothetical protein
MNQNLFTFAETNKLKNIMKNIQFLFKGTEYNIKTQFSEHENLTFTGFQHENDDVTLACFEHIETKQEVCFDISVSSNEVILD